MAGLPHETNLREVGFYSWRCAAIHEISFLLLDTQKKALVYSQEGKL